MRLFVPRNKMFDNKILKLYQVMSKVMFFEFTFKLKINIRKCLLAYLSKFNLHL